MVEPVTMGIVSGATNAITARAIDYGKEALDNHMKETVCHVQAGEGEVECREEYKWNLRG